MLGIDAVFDLNQYRSVVRLRFARNGKLGQPSSRHDVRFLAHPDADAPENELQDDDRSPPTRPARDAFPPRMRSAPHIALPMARQPCVATRLIPTARAPHPRGRAALRACGETREHVNPCHARAARRQATRGAYCW
jgi:hypothetical protein